MGRSEGRFPSFEAFRSWLELCPAGTTLAAHDVLAIVATLPQAAAPSPAIAPEPVSNGQTWRERLWTCAPETRLGVAELCEALGRPRSFVYRHTSAKTGLSLLPHRKIDGELAFVAGELRVWIRDNEETIVAGRAEAPALTISRRAS